MAIRFSVRSSGFESWRLQCRHGQRRSRQAPRLQQELLLPTWVINIKHHGREMCTLHHFHGFFHPVDVLVLVLIHDWSRECPFRKPTCLDPERVPSNIEWYSSSPPVFLQQQRWYVLMVSSIRHTNSFSARTMQQLDWVPVLSTHCL
jgi:hypothetical protein